MIGVPLNRACVIMVTIWRNILASYHGAAMRHLTLVLLFVFFPLLGYAQAWTPAERNISVALNDINSSTATFAEVMSYSTLVVGIGHPLTQFIYSMVRWDDRVFKDCLTSSFGLGLSVGLSYAAKLTYNRTRPFAAYPDDIVSHGAEGLGSSFPSNHTGMAFESATMLTLQYRYWYVGVPAYLWACTVGYSRLALGAHYLSDVGIGAALGTVSAVACYYINDAIWRRIDNRPLLKPKDTSAFNL